MESKNKLFENIYQENKNGEITSRDKIELLTDFINKMKNLIHQGEFIIEALQTDINKH
jgi:hypothetical protein